MLTITTEKHVIHIDINLLKKRFKSAFITLLKVSTYILAFIGIFWIVGTAGASDLGEITIIEIIKNVVIGFAMLGGAWILNKLKMYCK